MGYSETFGELRSLVQRRGNTSRWNELIAFVEALELEDPRRVDEELLPYVKSALASWDVDVCVASLFSNTPAVIGCARTLIVYGSDDGPSAEEIAARLDEVGDARLAGVERLEMSALFQNPIDTLDALLARLPDLRELDVSAWFATDPARAARRGQAHIAQTPDFVDVIVDRVGARLRGLGMTFMGMGDYATPNTATLAWDRVLERIDEVPDITSLYMAGSPRSGGTDWTSHLLELPEFDELEEFVYNPLSKRFDPSWLTERAASVNLRRVKVLGGLTHANAVALVEHPNLQGVQSWQLHHDFQFSRRRSGWDGHQSRYWDAHRGRGITFDDLLSVRRLDLSVYGVEQIHALLMGPKGHGLRPSEKLNQLHVGKMGPRDLKKLFRHGAKAFPNLRVLTFDDTIEIPPERIAELGGHGLCDQLRHLDYAIHPWQFDRATWHEVAQDESLHEGIRQRAWRAMTMHLVYRRETEQVARLVGSSGVTHKNLERLRGEIEAARPDYACKPTSIWDPRLTS